MRSIRELLRQGQRMVRLATGAYTNRWIGFEDDAYEIMDLGRPAVFLVPSTKLKCPMGKKTVEVALHEFLMDNFGAFTTTVVPYYGFWRADGERVDHDECRRYEVSFVGKHRIADLMRFIAQVASATNEICIYFKAGQYTCLIYPRP